jgi:hypothetical protein
MADPLAEVVTLLHPGAPFSKLVSARGPWRVRRSEAGQLFYCVILDGACRLAADGHGPIAAAEGRLRPDPFGVRLHGVKPGARPRTTSTPRPSRCPMANSDSGFKAASLTFAC